MRPVVEARLAATPKGYRSRAYDALLQVPHPKPTIAIVAAVAEMLLHAWTAVFMAEGGVSAFSLGLFVWSSLPYLACLLIALRARRPWMGLCGALAALCVDWAMYYSVFIAPGSSTAALGLLVAPLINLVVVVPVAVLLAYLLGRLRAAPPAG